MAVGGLGLCSIAVVALNICVIFRELRVERVAAFALLYVILVLRDSFVNSNYGYFIVLDMYYLKALLILEA